MFNSSVDAATPTPPQQQEEEQEQNDQSQQEWETMARAWLSSFPEAKEVTMPEVEAWLDSNLASLPEGLRSMPRPDLCLRLISIQNCMRLPSHEEKEANQLDLANARFQRTDQWMPVYSWLETLDKDEVVKSKEISDWLTENPKVQEQLCSRHSKYHLMHYIKKCHLKILKRREKRKGLEKPDKDTSLMVQKDVPMKYPTPLPSSSINNLPKDSDLFLAKRNEAYRKYEMQFSGVGEAAFPNISESSQHKPVRQSWNGDRELLGVALLGRLGAMLPLLSDLRR